MIERQCTMDISSGFSNVNVNKMIESSRSWNLANDVELLKCLERFSEIAISNATITLSSMDDLEDSLNETYLKVRTVANKFQAIADNQFIENRVQEEEDFVLANDGKDSLENQISSENSRTQLLDCIRDCQNAIGKKFDTVQLSGIDLEDEMANSSPVVLVPKNVYKERRLPHLIGGEQFKTDETLGLGSASDSIDDSIEYDNDADETDRSSYYPSNATEDFDTQISHTQVAPVKPIVKAVEDPVIKSSPPKDNIPVPPPFMSAFLSREPPRIDDDPPFEPSTLSSITLLPEAPNLHEPVDTLFSDSPEDSDTLFRDVPKYSDRLFSGVPEPSDEEFITSDSIKDDIPPNPSNTKNEATTNVSSNSSVSREVLLSASVMKKLSSLNSNNMLSTMSGPSEMWTHSRNFASFKEDLARVLSGVKSPRKPSSSDSDGSKSDLSSPAQGTASDKVGTTVDFSPQPATRFLSSPAQSNIWSVGPAQTPTHNAAPSQDNSGAVTLPSVSTNVLENLAKGRAKVKGRRRPPSRKHRQANIEGDNDTNQISDQSTNPLNSAHSDDTSVHESSSTQPGSNILSPATDEEDLFVLPAFDLPSDPPSRGLFFGNSLLSPGTTIDDGGALSSPLFPPDTIVEVPPKSANLPITSHPPDHSPVSIRKNSSTNVFEEPNIKGESLFSSNSSAAHQTNTDESGFPKQQSSTIKSSVQHVSDTNLFPETSSMIDGLNDKIDIFSSINNENEFSSSPPLFSDWVQPPDGSSTNKKTTAKSSMRSSLKWDLLGSNDSSEDLFRSQKKESLGIPSLEEQKPSKNVVQKTDKSTIFSPSLSFEKSSNVNLFEDDSNFSAPDIFAESSSFMGLSLPKNPKDSLFASDDDEDDDSLFKSSKTTSIFKSTGSSTKPQETPQTKKTPASKTSSSTPIVKDPLSSMD